MELDDLRGQWQAQTQDVAATQPSLQPAQENLIDKMRRNSQRDLALSMIIAVGILVYIALTEWPKYQLLGAFVLLSVGVTLFYNYQKLELLKRMARNDGSIHGHLDTLYKGLRKLLRFYKSVTLAAGPIAMLLMLGPRVSQELARTGPIRWKVIGIYLVFVLIFSALMYAAAVYSTRRYHQRLYGQHLDRLEAALRELEAPE